MNFVHPKVYLIGFPQVHMPGLLEYLIDTGQEDFYKDWEKGKENGLSDGECLCSFYAKLCYQSLVVGKNKNITKIRSIWNNLVGAFESSHGSIFEHCNINFIAANVSRIETHEHIRHRVGAAYSQNSGRFIRGDHIDFIHDPILDEIREDIKDVLDYIEGKYNGMVKKLGLDEETNFDKKKKITSALRRILPNGQANELGFTFNIRELRHFVMLRSSRHSETEIRHVAEQVYKLTKNKFPLLYYGAKEEMVEGILEITGMKMQPYA